MSFVPHVRNIATRRMLNQFSVQQRSKSSVGFIGLGNMGFSMAKNLLNHADVGKKTPVVVYDLNKEAVKKLADMGAVAADSVASLASQCNVIVTMLPATAHVSSTLLGPNGVFENCPKGTLIIDSSTIDPITSQNLAKTAISKGLEMIDAPVSGGVNGAAAGTLTFMVGGTEATFNRAKVYLGAMGKNLVHCGDAGAGGVTKLCNNLSLAISMIGTCEAMALGKRMGLDPVKLAGVMNTSTARCWSSDSYNPVPGVMPNTPASRGYTGGFGTALMAKDLSLALDVATASKARLPLGANALQLYGLLCEHGYAEKDFSAVYEFLTKTLPK